MTVRLSVMLFVMEILRRLCKISAKFAALNLNSQGWKLIELYGKTDFRVC